MSSWWRAKFLTCSERAFGARVGVARIAELAQSAQAGLSLSAGVSHVPTGQTQAQVIWSPPLPRLRVLMSCFMAVLSLVAKLHGPIV